MAAEEKLLERYNAGSDDALTERYAGARVIVNAETERANLIDAKGTISHFENGYVVIGGFEGIEGLIDMFGFPVEWFGTGAIKFEC